jgi:hypothetical protein
MKSMITKLARSQEKVLITIRTITKVGIIHPELRYLAPGSISSSQIPINPIYPKPNRSLRITPTQT